ncbi:MAG: periplasmic protein TonB [Pyrinomonadaceae bacterium]|jgi:protein TonB|nr:periplasmic protein TonB [Pyrinomonadaceae bacterium]
MLRRIGSFTFSTVMVAALGSNAFAQSSLTAKANPPQPSVAHAIAESDRSRDGLVGPVRRVRTEVVKLSSESGKLQEGKHAVLEVVAYDIKGNKTENQYFPIAGENLTGKEVYKYDDKGNISEMTLLNADGSLASKEVYKYEFDFAGNWNKMTTAVAVIEAGKMSFEPMEVTYRSIMYYLDENMLKMTQPAAQPAAAVSSNAVAANVEPKSVPLVAKANNSASNSKPAATLPGSVNMADKLNGLGSVEATGVRSNTNSGAPLVQLESEPPPAPRTILKPVSGGVLNGTAVSLPAPSYPDTAKRLRVSGLVSVEVIVDETGKVISATATGGPAQLREVAVQAALRARFSPTKLSGQPVKVSGSINYKFALSQ